MPPAVPLMSCCSPLWPPVRPQGTPRESGCTRMYCNRACYLDPHPRPLDQPRPALLRRRGWELRFVLDATMVLLTQVDRFFPS